MSLEIHTFPENIIESALSVPQDIIQQGTYNDIATYLQTQKITKPTYISQSPIVLGLSSRQAELYTDSFNQPTPTEFDNLAPTISGYGVLQLALASALGAPSSISSIRNGAMLQDIFPKESAAAQPSSSYGSAKEFVYHNDMSFLDDAQIPDYITLGCIRNVEGAATSVANTQSIISELGSAVLQQLKTPQYNFRHSYHKGTPQEATTNKQSPIITTDGQIRLGVDMVPTTLAAKNALRSLQNVIIHVATPQILTSGQILVLPNKHSVHARNAFTMAKQPANRRWLQRISIFS